MYRIAAPMRRSLVVLGSGCVEQMTMVKGPKILTLIFLPARSPELNRVGKVWQALRENGLSNRLLEDHADCLAAGCDAWTRLMKEPTAIKSGTSRDWTQNAKPEGRQYNLELPVFCREGRS